MRLQRGDGLQGAAEMMGVASVWMFDRVTQTLEPEFFEYLLDLEVRKAVRYLYFFSLAIVQPDQSLPEAHQEALLHALAMVIRDEIRGTDIIGRIAAERFFVLLHQADYNAAHGVAERIRQRVEGHRFTAGEETIHLSISLGVACFPSHANELEGLIRGAERALVEAKEAGGNRVMLPE